MSSWLGSSWASAVWPASPPAPGAAGATGSGAAAIAMATGPLGSAVVPRRVGSATRGGDAATATRTDPAVAGTGLRRAGRVTTTGRAANAPTGRPVTGVTARPRAGTVTTTGRLATMTGRGTATTTPIGSPAGSATGSRPPAAARRRPGGTVVTTRRAAMTTSPAAATGATPANARTGAASTSAATATATATTRVRASIGSFAESSIDRGVSGECLRLPRAAIRSVAEKRPRTAPAVLTHAQSGDYPHFPRVRPLRRGSNDVRGNARGMDGYPSGLFAPELRSERQPGECGADHDHDGARQAAPGTGPPVRRRGRGGESGRLQGRPGRGL